MCRGTDLAVCSPFAAEVVRGSVSYRDRLGDVKGGSGKLPG